jgi:uncharacterized protein (TIGR02596 family)
MTLKAGGFTLIELLVVLAIMIVLIGFATPSFVSLISSSKLTQAGVQVHDQLAQARQEAVTKNREVQAVFMQLRDPSGSVEWRAMQLWIIQESPTGPEPEPLGKIAYFGPPNIISADTDLSPMLSVEPYAPGADPVNAPSVDDKLNKLLEQIVAQNGFSLETWSRLRIKANGSVDSSVTTTNSFVTMHSSHDQADPPRNYVTIQINPITAKVTTFRP